MDRAWLEPLYLAAGILVWWLGVRKFEVGSTVKVVLALLDGGLLIGLALSLGWEGLIIFAGANIGGVLVQSVRLAMRQEAILVGVATRVGASKQDAVALHGRLGKHERMSWLGPIERAEWMREIAYRGRNLQEMEAILPAIAGLAVIHQVPDAAWLIARFDQIMRLYGEPAERAEEVAATVHATVGAGAAPFDEMVDALVLAASPL